MHATSGTAAFLLRRSWLIVLLALAGAAVGWLFATTVPEQYQRTAVFVVRPQAGLEAGSVPDAVRGLAQQDSQLVRTIARVLETDRILQPASLQALGTPLPDDYSVNASVSPGSDVVRVALRGPEPADLVPLARELTQVASGWVGTTYRAYALERIENRAEDGPVSPDVVQIAVLAGLIGGLLGFAAALIEAHWRQSRVRAEDAAAGAVEPGASGPSPNGGDGSPARARETSADG